MAKITITEALQEIKTIGSRIGKKESMVRDYLVRQEKLRDPLEESGGSIPMVAREMQAIKDLRVRIVKIRKAITDSNTATDLTIGTKTMTVFEWLVWRRDVAPGEQLFLSSLFGRIKQVRDASERQGARTVDAEGQAKMEDVRVNLNEAALRHEAEELDALLSVLDGRLSLLNATTLIEIPD